MSLFGNFGNGFLNWGSAYNTPINGMANPLGIQPTGISSVANAANDVAKAVSGGNGSGWFNTLFGDNKGGLLSSLGGLGLGIMQGLTGLQQMNMANRALNLANKQFGFQKDLANRNLLNQAKIINNTYDNAARIAAGMSGGRDATGRYGFTDPAVVRQYEANARKQHVDGSAI